MTQGKADKQAGKKLFNALRELEVQLLNGGYSVQTSAQKLLKDHGYTPANQMAKYLIAQSILKKDEQNSTHKKPYYYYNGDRLTVKYCNELILAMKLDRSASKRTPPCRPEENPFPIDKDPDGRDEKPPLPPRYVDPEELKAAKELEKITYARIEEQDKEIEELKHTLEMRSGELKYEQDVKNKWRVEAEKWINEAAFVKAENDKLKKKVKKIKKLLKAVL